MNLRDLIDRHRRAANDRLIYSAEFKEEDHPRDDVGQFTEQEREAEVKKLVKGAVGKHIVTQKRAKKGGELGPNGEWYDGGAFIATTDMPKRVRNKIEQSAIGKVQVEGYKWEVPQPGKMSILDRLGGTILNPRNGEINYHYVRNYQKYPEDEIKDFETIAERWKKGERWIDVLEFPKLASIQDAARLVVSGQAVPGELLKKFPEEWRKWLEKYKA